MSGNPQANGESASQLTNSLFPPPPAHYKHFTDANLAKYTELQGGPSGTSKGRAASPAPVKDISTRDTPPGRNDLTDEERSELVELTVLLDKPRADWVIDEGRWLSFGAQYSTDPAVPTLSEIGLPAWVDPNESPQTSLPPLLHSFLHTLLLLLDTLTNSARIPGELEEKGFQHEGDQYIQHLSNLAATMMVSVNQLRSVQSESTLVMVMEKQVETRREQTQLLRDKCRSIASRIKALKEAAGETHGLPQVVPTERMDVDRDGGGKVVS